MGRKRTELELTAKDRAAIDYYLNTTEDLRERERLDFAIKAATGKHTLEDLARLTGRSRSTLQNWLAKLRRGGVNELLKREAAPGRVTPLVEEQVQAELRQGIESKRWTTAQQVANWLRQRHGIKRTRKSIYYWLHKISSQTV